MSDLKKGEKYIFDGQFNYLELSEIILNEEIKDNEKIDKVFGVLKENIPEEILKRFSAKQMVSILGEAYDYTDGLENTDALNEMFLAGDISIPVQGLKTDGLNMEIVKYNVFAPILISLDNIKRIKYDNRKS